MMERPPKVDNSIRICIRMYLHMYMLQLLIHYFSKNIHKYRLNGNQALMDLHGSRSQIISAPSYHIHAA